ncbi:MAG: copper amine oxidase N-terminal domain-containing protein [Firmicutes bacterium]|nr:copper amine oxidase N-terminal domain-containing protein [Bacillota bacterium]
MSIKSRKLFAILVVTMMVLSLLPMTAFAASTNTIDKVPQVASDYEFEQDPPVLSIKEKDTNFSPSGETFRLSLTNAEWLMDDNDKYLIENWTDVTAVTVLTKTLAEVTIVGTGGAGAPADVYVYDLPLYTKITGEGEAQVTVDARDSRLSSGTYVFANAAAGKTIASISKVTSFAGTSKDFGTIQIDETRIGSLGVDNDGDSKKQTIKIKLPPKFEWVKDDAKASFGGGFDNGDLGLEAFYLSEDKRTLELSFLPSPTTRTTRGSILLKGLQVKAYRDAPYGEVVASISGGPDITEQDLVVANYASYNVEVSVDEVKEIVAGQYDDKTAKITIQENVVGALIGGRELSVVLPEWVKVNSVKNLKASGGYVTTDDLEYATNQNEIYFTVKETSKDKKSKYEFELELSVEADKTGDIVAEFFGAGIDKQEVVIAKAVAPVTVEVNPTDVKIGVQNQSAPDIIITETAKGRIDNDTEVFDGDRHFRVSVGDWEASGQEDQLTITLPTGITFSELPTVEVTEGNLELSPAKLDDDKRVLYVNISSSSTKPSTIKISDIRLTLDRTVPEGDFFVDVGGGSIVKNDNSNSTIKKPVTFNKARVVRALFGKVITPAPGETRATTTFTIDSTTYTVVENNVAVEKTMDVAPYLKNGRTYLPVRFVAYALGVSEDNIIWDPVKASVTVFKGDRIAQMTIGSNVLMVNGVELTMDAVPEITDGRTMLPVRWVAQALGATIDWDADTQTVTVKQ